MSDAAVAASVSSRARLKAALQSHPVLWRAYRRAKQELSRIAVLRYFLYDIRQTYRAMHWPAGQRERRALSSELFFQFHKLEKGLVMPGKPRLFGVAAAIATIDCLERWCLAGHSTDERVFLAATETLRAYAGKIDAEGFDSKGIILPQVNEYLQKFAERPPVEELRTPRQFDSHSLQDDNAGAAFARLTLARRSVRNFLPKAVEREKIEEAVRLAQLSPSACNRQALSVHVVQQESRKRELLALQNGNRGFGHLIPCVALIAADERCFFDASERHEPYIDGGLFSMSFILALRAQGLASCCLNWCVPPLVDREAHRVIQIENEKRIIMLVAIGYAPAQCEVPRSGRRDLGDILSFL